MRLLAVVKNPAGIARYLAAVGELTEVPGRSPPRAPPYWKSQVLRRQALGDDSDGGDHGRGERAAWPWATRQRKRRKRKRGLPQAAAMIRNPVAFTTGQIMCSLQCGSNGIDRWRFPLYCR